MAKRLILTILGVSLMLVGLAALMGAAVFVSHNLVLERLVADPAYVDAGELETSFLPGSLASYATLADRLPDAASYSNVMHPEFALEIAAQDGTADSPFSAAKTMDLTDLLHLPTWQPPTAAPVLRALLDQLGQADPDLQNLAVNLLDFLGLHALLIAPVPTEQVVAQNPPVQATPAQTVPALAPPVLTPSDPTAFPPDASTSSSNSLPPTENSGATGQSEALDSPEDATPGAPANPDPTSEAQPAVEQATPELAADQISYPPPEQPGEQPADSLTPTTIPDQPGSTSQAEEEGLLFPEFKFEGPTEEPTETAVPAEVPNPENQPGERSREYPLEGGEIPLDGDEIETLVPPPAKVERSQPIVRLRIPALKIKRAVIDIGVVGGPNGQDWDTDRLFANRNRPDLVGHLEGSAYPGESSNIVLVGHNYDYNGSGVFVNLQKLDDGDEIILTTESGEERVYEVIKVKTLPWSGGTAEDIRRHFRFLGPSGDEQLTLVSCGGANIGFFNKRVYVVAVPVE